MNNPFDYMPDEACEAAFRQLLGRLEMLRKSGSQRDIDFCQEIDEGKMLGVLVAADSSSGKHVLYAFSGQIGNDGFYFPGFVGPVFDYLQPDGYFKTKEAEISRLNKEIAQFERERLAVIKCDYDRAERRLNTEVAEHKELYRLSKMERDARRASGLADATELAAMIRRSQYEKAELRRLKKRIAVELEPYESALKKAQADLHALKERRRSESEALQKWLFDNFRLLNACGESKSLSGIFAETSMKIPPSGAGECCAPKLLHAAYKRGWKPVAMAEYWYGRPKDGEVRIHGHHYPACRGKCRPVVGWMLKGLEVNPPLAEERRSIVAKDPEIIYENNWFCVVDKPSGMLSVPGKSEDISLQQWLEDKYGADREVKMAHRLDQDTSGLIIATFGQRAFKMMQSLFATRKVRKRYLAELEGDYEALGHPRSGRIELPLSPDLLDRPRQRVDPDSGKEGVTDYEFIGVKDGLSRVVFHPHTGRTHQLRVHAASRLGLGMPIAGDRLYGGTDRTWRLHLHALMIEFVFPIDGRQYHFETPLPDFSID